MSESTESSMLNGRDAPSIKSAERTIDIIEFLARQDRPLSAMTIVRCCAIPKSSAYQLLKALEARGFISYRAQERGWVLGERVRQLGSEAATVSDAGAVLDAFATGAEHLTAAQVQHRTGLRLAAIARTLEILSQEHFITAHDDGSHALGARAASLAARFTEIARLRIAARPALLALRDETGETANLLTLEGDRAIYIEQVESKHVLRHSGWIGLTGPVNQDGAASRALLGHEGVLVAVDTVEEGVTAIACAIDASSLGHRAAVSVTGPTGRLHGERIDVARAAVAVAAGRIEEGLAEGR